MASPSRPALAFSEQVARATGLAGMLGHGALKRCCARIRVNPKNLTPADLSRILIYLEPLLELYLPKDQARSRAAELRQLAASSDELAKGA